MSSRIAATSMRWRRSAPSLAHPGPGGSIPELLLRLDESNAFASGTSWKVVRYRPVRSTELSEGNALARARSFDLERVAELAGLTIRETERLTFVPLLHWMYGPYRSIYQFGSRVGQRICPGCARERSIQLLSLLPDILGCPRHGSKRLLTCRCGAAFKLFLGQRSFHCHRCGAAYADLEAPRLHRMERIALGRRVALYEDLLARAEAGTERPQRLLNGLELIARWGELDGDAVGKVDRRLRRGVNPPLAWIVDLLLASGCNIDDLICASRAVRSIRRCPHCGDPRTLISPHAHEAVCPTCQTHYSDKGVLASLEASRWYPDRLAARLRATTERLRAMAPRRARAVLDRLPWARRAALAARIGLEQIDPQRRLTRYAWR